DTRKQIRIGRRLRAPFVPAAAAASKQWRRTNRGRTTGVASARRAQFLCEFARALPGPPARSPGSSATFWPSGLLDLLQMYKVSYDIGPTRSGLFKEFFWIAVAHGVCGADSAEAMSALSRASYRAARQLDARLGVSVLPPPISPQDTSLGFVRHDSLSE